MGPNVRNHLDKTRAQSHPTADRTPQSTVGSPPKNLFQSLLSKIQNAGRETPSQEINSPQTGTRSLQMAIPVSKPGGKIKFALQAPKVSQGEGPSTVSAATQPGSNSSSPRSLSMASLPAGSSRESALNGMEGAADPRIRSYGQLRKIQIAPGIGALSARFESGGEGIDTIGYDAQGGTSYGTYQIASRPGSMRLFIDFLRDQEPEWARRLDSAGPLNTGGRGGRAPREWQKIAAEAPERFARLQHEFISQTHYLPALQEIQERTGVDFGAQSSALQEVLWSTAVQHGPRGAARIFSNAIAKAGASNSADGIQFEQRLIDRVYSARGKRFGGSSERVATAVRRRFEEERELAHDMLREARPRSFRA